MTESEERILGDAFSAKVARVEDVSDEGRVLLRYLDGHIDVVCIPLERVPRLRRLLANGPAELDAVHAQRRL